MNSDFRGIYPMLLQCYTSDDRVDAEIAGSDDTSATSRNATAQSMASSKGQS